MALDHGATKDVLHHQEQLLVDLARTLTFDQFQRMVEYWALHYDPTAPPRRPRAPQPEGAYLVRVWTGPGWAG